MTDDHENARKIARKEKELYPHGEVRPQHETGFSWDLQKTYENEWKRPNDEERIMFNDGMAKAQDN